MCVNSYTPYIGCHIASLTLLIHPTFFRVWIVSLFMREFKQEQNIDQFIVDVIHISINLRSFEKWTLEAITLHREQFNSRVQGDR